MNLPIRLLHLEDDPLDADLIQHILRSELDCHFIWVSNKAAFESTLMQGDFDLVLSDFNLPDYDGMSALRFVREYKPELPVIVISGRLGEEEAVECLKAGATDYVLKQRLQRLCTAVRRALAEQAEYLARRQAEDEVAHQHAFLRQVIDLDRNFIFAKDREGRFVLVNKALADAYGVSVENLIGKTDADFNPNGDEVELFRRADLRVMNTLQELFIPEERITDALGHIRWLQTVKRPIISEDETADRVLGVSVDITERKRQEQRLARLNHVHTMLSGINSAITRIRDRNALLHEACRIAVDDGGFKLASCGYLDKEKMELRPLLWVGDDGGILDDFCVPFDHGDNGGVFTANRKINMNEPFVINKIRDAGVYSYSAEGHLREQVLLEAGFQSFAVLPLRIEGRFVGTLALYSLECDVFDLEEVELLKELADDISFALDYLEKQEALNYAALFDMLTNLPNRQLFFERSAQLIQANLRTNTKLALVVIDVRRFGMINDSFGKASGDQALKSIAERLSKGAAITCGRIGANTFAVAIPDLLNDGDVAHALHDFVITPFSQPFEIGNQEITITARFGVALFPNDGEQIDALVGNAEAALKKAKLSGHEYLFYTPDLNARVSEQLTLENQLRKAVTDNQFVLYYQPKVASDDGSLVGFEALIRWVSPERGIVPPMEFVPILEESGIILDVGTWVLQQAAADYRAWHKKGLNPPPIAVNISALQLRRLDFVEIVLNAIAPLAGQIPVRIDLEITETVLMENLELVIPSLQMLKDADMHIAIDDFGTGYSSFSYLTKIPLDFIKIDRSFITELTSHQGQMTVVSTIILLAHALNLKVIAEGVETVEQHVQLQQRGCDELQGYLFGKPMPSMEVEALLAAPRRQDSHR